MPRCGVAAPSDTEGIVELIRSAYRGDASRQGWTSEADLVEGERINAEQVLAMIRGQASRMLVLDTDEGIVACCALEDREAVGPSWHICPRQPSRPPAFAGV